MRCSEFGASLLLASLLVAAVDEQRWRSQIRATLFVPEPLPELRPQLHGRFQAAPGVIAERVSYGTQFGMRVPAILYLPESPRGKIPALIIVNGHGGDKYSWYAFYAGILYARAGAAVLTYDPVGEGERNINRQSGTRAHDKIEGPPELARRLAGLMITDVMQAVTYLAGRPEVDARRIAAAGYSMGSFVLSLACAVDTRLRACVLVGGGNLDGPGGYWDKSKPMCQGIPYQSLMFLGDRAAAIYALHASRGPTLVYNGLEDVTVAIPRFGVAGFRDLQRRVAQLRGTERGVFETGFAEGAGHRPYFVTKPVALWLEKHLDFPNWTEETIQAMPETRISEWARAGGVALDPLYASQEREGGTPALGRDVPALTREQLSVFSTGEWEQRKQELVLEAWLEKTRAQMSRPASSALPGRYFELIEAGIRRVEQDRRSMSAEAFAGIRTSHYHPGALLGAAVLYSQRHPSNPRRGDRRMLELALLLGDLLAAESETGKYTTRHDHHRDTYMWLEAYRLLAQELGEQRRERWRRELEKQIAALADTVAARRDRPRYTSPFGVPTNHTALQASTVYLAGRLFSRPEWEKLGAQVMHRYATQEQSPDGYWGEHSPNGPTTAYDYLTATGVALYYEYSRDPAALEALRRSTDFHKYFTWPDGQPVMVIDDRRRHAYISPWGHFGFSHFPDGRRYAEFLTGFYRAEEMSLEHLGRLAQNIIYFHEGPTEAVPQDLPAYCHQMRVPAGIRKSGPWVICLSGLRSTQAVTSRYYLDRQGHLSVFHQRRGLLITGANSKGQPELATFWEKIPQGLFHLPLDSRLEMKEAGDRLALAYNTFFAVLEIPPPKPERLEFRFRIQRKSAAREACLNLQLCLKEGDVLEAGRERSVLGREHLELSDVGGVVGFRGALLRVNKPARLRWPVYPYNPYAAGPERDIQHAVGLLSVPFGEECCAAEEIAFSLELVQ